MKKRDDGEVEKVFGPIEHNPRLIRLSLCEQAKVDAEFDRILGNFKAAEREYKEDLLNAQNLKKLSSALEDVVSKEWPRNQEVVQCIRDAQSVFLEASQIKEVEFHAKFQLGMIHLTLVRSSLKLVFTGDDFEEHCRKATAYFQEVGQKAPNVVKENSLEPTNDQMPVDPEEDYFSTVLSDPEDHDLDDDRKCRGMVIGQLRFIRNARMIDCSETDTRIPDIKCLKDMQTTASFILVTEKYFIFESLVNDRFHNRFNCIILQADGQPDMVTRLFLRKMTKDLKLPVLAIVDCDPKGLKNLSLYVRGSKNLSSSDSANPTIPGLKWLGLRPSDLDRLKLSKKCRLPMTETDLKIVDVLLDEDFVKRNPGWVKELSLMVKTKQKAETEALTSLGRKYLTKVYLPLKLLEHGFISKKRDVMW